MSGNEKPTILCTFTAKSELLESVSAQSLQGKSCAFFGLAGTAVCSAKHEELSSAG
jgi:hypothetical protein